MRLFLTTILACIALAPLGCSDDTTATTNNDNNSSNNIRTVPDAGTLPCSGCFVGDECQTMPADDACGAGGVECAPCATGERCNDDGECVEPPSCTRESCDGCCDANDSCITGDGASACGSEGNLCTECMDGAACVAGRCQTGCNPDNCAGCCDATGACITGDQDAACGTAGAICADCGAQGSVCGGGSCVATGCAQTCTGCCNGDACVEAPTNADCGTAGGACTACTEGQVCTTGACQAVSGSAWDLVILSADVTFWDWDVFSNPDPYVYAYTEDAVLGGYWENETSVQSETFSPIWDETIMVGLTNEALTAGLYLELNDSDVFGPERICEYQLTPDASAFSGVVVESVCAGDPSTVLRWRLVPGTP